MKASTKYCWSGSPVRLRTGATATPMFGNRHGQRGVVVSWGGASGLWGVGRGGERSAVLGRAMGSRSSVAGPGRLCSLAPLEREISFANNCVSTSGATPSSRFNVSAQLLYWRRASPRRPACAYARINARWPNSESESSITSRRPYCIAASCSPAAFCFMLSRCKTSHTMARVRSRCAASHS